MLLGLGLKCKLYILKINLFICFGKKSKKDSFGNYNTLTISSTASQGQPKVRINSLFRFLKGKKMMTEISNQN